MDESTATVEYSLMLAGNENEKAPKEQEISNDSDSNLQIEETVTGEEPVKPKATPSWYSNKNSVPTIKESIGKMSKA